MYIRTLLLAATALSFPFTGTPALAQVAENGLGEEIIITARKKEESLQDAPVTVAVVTARSIENQNLQDLSDIAKTTAGLSFDNEFGRTSNRPVIRGQANIQGESGVATFIDGVYVTGSIADYDVEDIGRIEVVKGPQSALYGRNTYAGAINIVTRSPGQALGARFKVDVAEHDRYEITGTIEAPLAPGLGVAVTGRYYDFGGEFTNLYDGKKVGRENTKSISGVIDYDGGALRARARAYYADSDDSQPALFQQPTEANNCLFDNGSFYRGPGRYFCGVIEPAQINTDYARQFADGANVGDQTQVLNTSLRLDYDFTERVTLTSITGYNTRDSVSRLDGDYSPGSFQTAVFTPGGFPIGGPVFGPGGPRFPHGYVGSTIDFTFENESDTKEFSQELRVAYDGDRFDLIFGAYYFDQSSDTRDIREVPADAAARAAASFGAARAQQTALCAANPRCLSIVPLFGPTIPESRNRNNLDTENIAVFGAATFDITDALSISLEGRYAEETIERSAFQFNEGQPVPAAVLSRAKFTSFTPRITANYSVTENNLLYGVYAEGLKPGGFNGVIAIAAGVPDFAEEESKSYEIGSKNSFLGGSFILNLAAFINEIDGYQLTQNVQSATGGNTVSATVNAGDARIKGLELEMIARPTPGFTLTGNLAYLDPNFTSGFDENQGVLNDVADDGLVNCSTGDQFPGTSGCQSIFGALKGKRIPRTARWTAFVDADVRRPLGSTGWNIFLGGNIRHETSKFSQVHNLAETGDATIVNARLGAENETFRVQLYGENLTDEDSVQLVLRYADANSSNRRSFVGGLRSGRTFGINVSARF